ncbi:type II toxin-antitoxin system Phd/YefM family antitoxin [Amycolatopsis sacchari]|uniref:type II toxin-antitoxin system Phd/YefM family antitoxin n=1 Tax=Amycolatopsis sacchari TaxID=115433 RepID=UPI003EB97F3D
MSAGASRHFSELLDAVERGETIVVRRKGKRIAMIAPAPRANAAVVNEVLAEWRGSPPSTTDSPRTSRQSAMRSSPLDRDPWLG